MLFVTSLIWMVNWWLSQDKNCHVVFYMIQRFIEIHTNSIQFILWIHWDVKKNRMIIIEIKTIAEILTVGSKQQISRMPAKGKSTWHELANALFTPHELVKTIVSEMLTFLLQNNQQICKNCVLFLAFSNSKVLHPIFNIGSMGRVSRRARKHQRLKRQGESTICKEEDQRRQNQCAL